MSDKNRLEEIQKEVNYAYRRDGSINTKAVTMHMEHYEYLYEQAERVQELEEANEKNYWIASDFKFKNLALEQQNKRYRDILEEVRQNMIAHYGLGGERDTYVRWSKELIDRELEGETE